MTPGRSLRHGSPRRSATPSPTNLSATASSPGTSRCSCAPARRRARAPPPGTRCATGWRSTCSPPSPRSRRGRSGGTRRCSSPPGGSGTPRCSSSTSRRSSPARWTGACSSIWKPKPKPKPKPKTRRAVFASRPRCPRYSRCTRPRTRRWGGGFARPPPSGACYPASRRTNDRGRCIPARAPRSSGWCTRHSRSVGGRRWRARGGGRSRRIWGVRGAEALRAGRGVRRARTRAGRARQAHGAARGVRGPPGTAREAQGGARRRVRVTRRNEAFFCFT